VSGEFPGDHRIRADFVVYGFGDGPSDLGRVRWNAAQHFALEIFDDLRAALFPPKLRGGDGAAILEFEDFGVIGEGLAEDSS
jgi:hypothetical protein